MEENSSSSCCQFGAVLCLVLAFNLFMASQVQTLWRTTTNLKQQEINIGQQLDRSQNEFLQARNMQLLLEALANDMLAMANTDYDVRRLVEKYQIRRAGPAPAPAPAR